MENSEFATMQEFKLNEDEQATIDIFYTCLCLKRGFEQNYFELDTFALKELVKEEDLPFSWIYKTCKRLLPIENKKLNDK